MINFRGFLLVFFIVVSCSSLRATPIPSTGTVDIYFSPNGGTTDAITHEIGNARSEILIQAYSFTSTPIAKALLDASKRGVRVVVVLDRSQKTQKYSGATFLAHAGIPVFIDDKHAIAHNKIIIIDRQTLITGSFNFSKAAEEKNAENLLALKGNSPLVDRYVNNFAEHKSHSEPYLR